jgi:hypothetical protein
MIVAFRSADAPKSADFPAVGGRSVGARLLINAP